MNDDDAGAKTAFLRRVQIVILCIATAAGFMSPLSINIYLPALPAITEELSISATETLVTITMFMVFQGISPAFWAPLSDRIGRRPVLIVSQVVFLAANLGLAFVQTFWLLLVLRMLQAFGGASSIAIGAGCIGDITTRRERGRFMGYFQAGSLLGPVIGPIIGGLLAQRWGWHAVFFFLAALSAAEVLLLVCCYPETLRALVGAGDRVPRTLWRTLLPYKLSQRQGEAMAMPSAGAMGFAQPWTAFLRPEICALISSYSLLFGAYVMASSSLPLLLRSNYGYGEIEIGLCYITFGVGAIAGSLVSGRLIDFIYKRRARKGAVSLLRTRMGYALWYKGIALAAFAASGWCLERRVHVSAALVMQFLLGLNCTMAFTSTCVWRGAILTTGTRCWWIYTPHKGHRSPQRSTSDGACSGQCAWRSPSRSSRRWAPGAHSR